MPVAAFLALSSGLLAARGVSWLTLSRGFFMPCRHKDSRTKHMFPGSQAQRMSRRVLMQVTVQGEVSPATTKTRSAK